MSWSRRIGHRLLRRVLLLGVPACVGAGIVIGWKPEIPAIPPPDHASFTPAAIARGANLAALGDCAVCHSNGDSIAIGPPYAGGRGVATPFGTVFATNITPDPTTGIGRWSLAAFTRAMRDGVARDGTHLYPVLPYPHFTKATPDDVAALYAFLMTRAPVTRVTPPPALSFPFNQRPLLAFWDAVFLDTDPWQPDPAKGAEWNRGAYLVDAIGHCGACHTPHNPLGAEEHTLAFTGGDAEGWYAPSLRAATPDPWTIDTLTAYLRTGLDKGHGVAAGPMAPVTRQLATVPDEDVHAIAVYVASLMSAASGAKATAPAAEIADSPVFDGACGACHAADAPMTLAGAPSLAVSAAVHAPTARNAVDVILHGLPWREGQAGPFMPGFAGQLTDAQVAGLAAYIRARYSDQPPWRDIDNAIREAHGP